MIELKHPDELILTKPIVHMSVLFVITGTFLTKILEFKPDIRIVMI